MIPAKGRSAQHDPCQAHQSIPRHSTLSSPWGTCDALKQGVVTRVTRRSKVTRWCDKPWKHGVVTPVTPKSALARIGASSSRLNTCPYRIRRNTRDRCDRCDKCYFKATLGVTRSVTRSLGRVTNRGAA